MQPQSPEALRAWFKHVEPLCAELFNAAHAMCLSYDLAEYALHCAILDVWAESTSGGMGFRERLRGALRREAFSAALSEEAADAEVTWQGYAVPIDGDAIVTQLARERVQTQRLATLRHGCGLSLRAIARLTGLSQRQVRRELEHFEERCRLRLRRQDRPRAEALIARRLRRLLTQSVAGSPQPAQIYRAFEAEANGAKLSGRGFSRVAGTVLIYIMALLCAGAFWLFAVLVKPG